MPVVLVPAHRWERWLANFAERHDATVVASVDGGLHGVSGDGSRFTAALPFDRTYEGDVARFADAAAPPGDWGVLLVRKGGFAVALMHGGEMIGSKVGQRHVQGRTKAGGQSQQRFARRRDNQARQAFEAAADHAVRVLGDLRGPLVTGGDHDAVEETLSDPRLTTASAARVARWLPVPDPRRGVLEQAIRDSCAISVDVHDTQRDIG
ncbi:acVLRF1 family peptidyl-tRNA hydrolase [Nocardioides sp. R-C-SC26]|uniref:acVLRF1 family peptidyl-tRNA hydrolase n=1 Tax=Nocardioides sp. R-C-SC26 TaxID=2870414 RepID=UPI001E3AC318|nr:acVLRF1 family peptidyl-tRNA hydrolase [Nocardioides sp. R-C-SC26]